MTDPYEHDCDACVGLCCVAPSFSRDDDFAYVKPAGQVCIHLDGGDRCRIHDDLEKNGFGGCVRYTCYGAGQRTTAEMRRRHPGRSWRDGKGLATEVFDLYGRLRNMHECIAKLRDTARRHGAEVALSYARILEQTIEDLESLPSEADVQGFQHVTQVMIDEIRVGNPIPFG